MYSQDYRIKDRDAGLSIIRKTHAETNPERHFHESYELLYIVSGERTFFYGSRTFHIKSGNFLCIKPGILHRAINRAAESCDLINIYFDDHSSAFFAGILPLLDACGTRDEPVLLVPELDRFRTAQVFQTVAQELDERRSGYVPLVWGLLLQCMAGFVRLVSCAPQPILPMNDTATLLVEYLSAHFRERLSLTTVADHFGLNASYLCRLFRQSTRFTFVEYLAALRVQEACRLLSETNASVGSIAERCGFGSLTQFGRSFRKITGDSPISWRKRTGKWM